MSHRELLPIPPIETATDPVHSAADMRQRWRALMGPLGFGQRLLWIGFVGPDRCMIKTISQVPVGSGANAELAESVMSGVRDVLTDFREGTTVALLLTRPGVGPISHLDRQWSSLLTDTAHAHGVPLESIFRANDESLVLVDPTLRAVSPCVHGAHPAARTATERQPLHCTGSARRNDRGDSTRPPPGPDRAGR